MDDIATRIQEYVLTIYPEILTALDIDEDYLTFMVGEVIDRVLVFTNRDQLVRQYEEDVEDYPITDKTDRTEKYYYIWRDYDSYPIPPRLEKVVAKVVIGATRTVQTQLTADAKEVQSLSDHGQSVTFKDKMTDFLNSSSESEVFSGSLELLERYLLPTVIKNGNTY